MRIEIKRIPVDKGIRYDVTVDNQWHSSWDKLRDAKDQLNLLKEELLREINIVKKD